MDLQFLFVLTGLLLFLGVFTAIWALAGRPAARLERLSADEQASEEEGAAYGVKAQAVLRQLGRMVRRSPKELSRVELKLVQAGIRRRDAPTLFIGVQASLVTSFLVAFGVAGLLRRNFFLWVILSVFLGSLLPDVCLALMVRLRKERIQIALPDALDMLVVCVEAGLGLDQALLRVGQELRANHPDLSDELRLMNLELNAGKSRAEALRNLARRTEVEDLRALVAVLIQTDRFGTSIADSLRVFSDSLRTKRRQRAEEAAAKMGVKMIPPLFFFILPATFAVVVGPAIIGIAKGLLPFLRQAR